MRTLVYAIVVPGTVIEGTDEKRRHRQQRGHHRRAGHQRQHFLGLGVPRQQRVAVVLVEKAVPANIPVMVMPVERPKAVAVAPQPVQDLLVKHPFHGVGGDEPQRNTDHGDLLLLLSVSSPF